MKVIEILNFNRELLKKLHEAGIRLEDTQYIDLYSDYMNLYKNGEKVSYIVAILSRKVCRERTESVWSFERFQSDCTSGAV